MGPQQNKSPKEAESLPHAKACYISRKGSGRLAIVEDEVFSDWVGRRGWKMSVFCNVELEDGGNLEKFRRWRLEICVGKVCPKNLVFMELMGWWLGNIQKRSL